MTSDKKSQVAVIKTGFDDDVIQADVRRCINLIGGISDIVKPGDRVLIKPNIVAPLSRGVTNFAILRAVIELVKEEGGDPFIGDCAGMEFDCEKTFSLLGFREFAKDLGVDLINFDNDELTYLPVRLGPIRRFAIPRSAVEADVIINLPKLKYHNLCRVTLGIKNIMGVASKKARRQIHVFGLHKGLALLSKLIHSDLTIIDGTSICERPVFGREKPLGILLASRDVVAIDKFACRFLDMSPRSVRHLRWAEKMGLGGVEIEVVGEASGLTRNSVEGGHLSVLRRMHRAAFWLTFASELVYHKITGKTLLPEANIRFGTHPVLERSLCTRCNICVEACPVAAIDMEKMRINYSLCREVRCMRCYEVCPEKAIKIKGIQPVNLE